MSGEAPAKGLTNGVLCLDVGSGTQDALLYFADRPLENCPKFVLPSPAKLVARRILALTARGAAIHLHGRNMGGGFVKAVRAHVAAGLPITAHPRAALALTDTPASLEARGIRLSDTCPPGHVPVHQADYDPAFWSALLGMAGLEPPDLVLACAQDHGHHPGQSSRIGRFRLWEDFLTQGSGRLEDLLYFAVPAELTRLAELQDATCGGPVMDTGPAAALGALQDPQVAAAADAGGVLVVNMGNSHVLGLLVRAGRLHGVYEHHSGMLEVQALRAQLEAFRTGALAHNAVFDSGGHGCSLCALPGSFDAVCVIGPRRAELSGWPGAMFPAPGGDMMLTGCFGMLAAWKARAAG